MHVPRAVRGMVLGDNELELCALLREHALDRLRDVPLVVVGQEADADAHRPQRGPGWPGSTSSVSQARSGRTTPGQRPYQLPRMSSESRTSNERMSSSR